MATQRRRKVGQTQGLEHAGAAPKPVGRIGGAVGESVVDLGSVGVQRWRRRCKRTTVRDCVHRLIRGVSHSGDGQCAFCEPSRPRLCRRAWRQRRRRRPSGVAGRFARVPAAGGEVASVRGGRGGCGAGTRRTAAARDRVLAHTRVGSVGQAAVLRSAALRVGPDRVRELPRSGTRVGGRPPVPLRARPDTWAPQLDDSAERRLLRPLVLERSIGEPWRNRSCARSRAPSK